MSQIDDIKQYKKFRANKNLFRNLIIIFIALILISVVFLIARFITQNNSQDRNEGNGFPIILTEQRVNAFDDIGKNLLLSTDSQNIIYDSSAKKMETYTHSYSKPIVKNNNDTVLAYDQGGHKLSINNEKVDKLEIELSSNIIFAEISDNGYVAVATFDERYKALLTVYNSELKPIYKYYINEYPTGLVFTSSKTCVLAVQGSVEGKHHAILYGLNFSKEEELFITDVMDCMVVNIELKKDNNLSVIGLNEVITFNSKGEQICTTALSEEIIAIDNSYDDYTVICTKDTKKANNSNILVLDYMGKEVSSLAIPAVIKDVLCDDMGIAVLYDNHINTYNYKMGSLNQYEQEQPYAQISRVDKHLLALNSKQIDKIN